jgi:hypothetical protein
MWKQEEELSDMNENITQEEALYSNDFAEDVKKRINDYGTEDFLEAREWWSKLGLKVTITEKEMINEIVKTLSEHLSKGLLQLTIEEIINEKKCKDAIKGGEESQTIILNMSRKLAPFKLYVELIVKSGSIEIKKFRYDFRAEPDVKIKDIQVNIQQHKIKTVSFGSLMASITLSLLKGDNALMIGSIEKSFSLPGPITL